jgi:hypothetical protein
MKRALGTFKRMALPLYAWYLILGVLGIILVVLSLIPLLVSLYQGGILGSEITGLPRIPGLPFAPEIPGNPNTSFPNPNPPVPPGSYPNPGSQAFTDQLVPFFTLAPKFLLSFIGLFLLSLLITSAIMTGIFHLTKKAYSGHAKFKDFRLKGFLRVLGWHGILTLLTILFVGIGAIIAFSLRETSYAIPIFLGSYSLLLLAVGIFLAPWFSSSVFYMLNHRELSFFSSFSGSWSFYRRHIGSFWGYFITAIILQILVLVVDQNSPNLGWIFSVLVTPFTTILPIVWVLAHEEEEHSPDVPLLSNYPTPLTTVKETESEPYSPKETNLSQPNERELSQGTAQPVNPHYSASHNTPQELTELQTQYSPKYDFTPQDSRYTPKADIPEDTQTYFCPTCGKDVRPGASYCSQCGTKL